MDTIDSRLRALGLTMPPAPQPVANYCPVLISGNMLHISGQLSLTGERRVLTGILGHSATVEEGQEAAQWCALNILAQAKTALGRLERIEQILRITGYVASTPTFTDHPKVINGASNLLVAVLGQAGRHTRSAVGVASLPLGAMVEIDAILKVG
jgi:enamine deaminase RidA (YjgF/YER057c/UK114 family)